MSKEGNSPMLDLKLNLSPQRAYQQVESLSNSSWDMSADCSCVSSEPEDMAANYPGSPDTTPMVLVGCPRCLMYIMLSEVDPKCPKCKSTALLDFLRDENTKKTAN
ncbi:hypothetical protein OIU85_015495 [Salix viminalis]|uniref:GIR1-like zinc ribbon domain-containing protein n=2 Tax=Salix TaxID=40685 RepID=A0A6N2LFR1_SALVM|nr:hypothetical protein OIU84_009611 [Salix udensis]KAJ6671755.1 hypothetical protein OIU85_015495 [Salix viminalis]